MCSLLAYTPQVIVDLTDAQASTMPDLEVHLPGSQVVSIMALATTAQSALARVTELEANLTKVQAQLNALAFDVMVLKTNASTVATEASTLRVDVSAGVSELRAGILTSTAEAVANATAYTDQSLDIRVGPLADGSDQPVMAFITALLAADNELENNIQTVNQRVEVLEAGTASILLLLFLSFVCGEG